MRVGQSTKKIKIKGNMRTFREVLCRVLTGSHLGCVSACCPMKHKFWELGAVEAVYTSPDEIFGASTRTVATAPVQLRLINHVRPDRPYGSHLLL